MITAQNAQAPRRCLLEKQLHGLRLKNRLRCISLKFDPPQRRFSLG